MSRKTKEAVQKYRYNQIEIADYLGIHYSTVSRLVNKDEIMQETRPDPPFMTSYKKVPFRLLKRGKGKAAWCKIKYEF